MLQSSKLIPFFLEKLTCSGPLVHPTCDVHSGWASTSRTIYCGRLLYPSRHDRDPSLIRFNSILIYMCENDSRCSINHNLSHASNLFFLQILKFKKLDDSSKKFWWSAKFFNVFERFVATVQHCFAVITWCLFALISPILFCQKLSLLYINLAIIYAYRDIYFAKNAKRKIQ